MRRGAGVPAAFVVLLAAGCARPKPLLSRRASRRGPRHRPRSRPTRAPSRLSGARVTGGARARAARARRRTSAAAGLSPVFETYPRPRAPRPTLPRETSCGSPGTDGARGLVLLAAHLDGVAVGERADDAVNVAVLLEAARSLKGARSRPRRTIRFAFFTGEEQKWQGSSAYVAAHAAQPHAIAAVFDLGSGRTKGFT